MAQRAFLCLEVRFQRSIFVAVQLRLYLAELNRHLVYSAELDAVDWGILSVMIP